MRRTGILILLLAVSFAAHASKNKPEAPTALSTQDVDAAREDVRLAAIYARNQNLAAAEEVIDRVIQVKHFDGLPDDLRYGALALAGAISEEKGETNQAHERFVRASGFSQSDSFVWSHRLATAFEGKDYRDSARCVTIIAKRWPSDLDSLNERGLIVLARKLDDPSNRDVQRDYLQSLFDAHWETSDGDPSELWRSLASLWLRTGDVQKAATVAARIQSARIVLSMRVDKQFDPLTKRNPRNYDVERVLAHEVDQARTEMKASPDKLGPVVRLQGLLLSMQRYEEVIALADEVMTKTRSAPGASTYKDFDEKYIWLLDERSRALSRLGRWDEAASQWQTAARRPEDGGMNVSQIINLGQLYADLRRPREALDTVQELGSVSDYGKMQQELVRLQAAIVQQDQAAIASHMSYMREHRNDAIATWQTALLHINDLDESAKLLIERLNTEQWRTDALSDMQNYADVQVPPMDVERMKRWRAVIARPDVQQALNKVGRIETFKLDPAET